jgi:hypothetical protein
MLYATEQPLQGLVKEWKAEGALCPEKKLMLKLMDATEQPQCEAFAASCLLMHAKFQQSSQDEVH